MKTVQIVWNDTSIKPLEIDINSQYDYDLIQDGYAAFVKGAEGDKYIIPLDNVLYIKESK
jgi:hypothetical protein